MFGIIELLKFVDRRFLFVSCWAIFEIPEVAKAVIIATCFRRCLFCSTFIKVREVSETSIACFFSLGNYILNNGLCFLRYLCLSLGRRWIRLTHQVSEGIIIENHISLSTERWLFSRFGRCWRLLEIAEVAEGTVFLFGRGFGWTVIKVAKITESVIAWHFLGWHRLSSRRRATEVAEIAKSIVAWSLWFSLCRLSKIRHFAKRSEIAKGLVTLLPGGCRLLNFRRLSRTKSAKATKHVVTRLILRGSWLATNRF